MVIPLIVVAGDEAAAIVAVNGPLTCVQVPVPTAAMLPAIVAEPLLAQMVCGEPALATVGGALVVIVTCDVLAVHGALLIVHWNTYDPTEVSAVIVVVGELAVVMVAVLGPLTCVQAPVPTDGVFAAMVTEASLVQTLCGDPAFATVGALFTVTATVFVFVQPVKGLVTVAV